MKITRRYSDDEVFFVIAELAPAYHAAAKALAYTEVNGEWVDLYPRNTPHLDRIFQTFERAIEPMLRQTAGLVAVPWQAALHDLVRLLDGEGIDWWLGGSAALAVRGLDVMPRDLDLIVDAAGAIRLGELLLPALVQPVQATPDWFCGWFGRAFMHVRIEWVGAVNERADQPQVSDFGPTAARQLEVVAWNGHLIRVPPLHLQLAVSRARGLADRVQKIEAVLIKVD